MTHCLVNHHIIGHIAFVLVSTEGIMMCPVIDNPTSCKICAVICFLHAKKYECCGNSSSIMWNGLWTKCNE
jgi:hypothetical protein